MKNNLFLNIKDLSLEFILSIFRECDNFLKLDNFKKLFLKKSVLFLFLEPSTRTKISFELASKNLGLNVIQFPELSSFLKDETLEDTLLNIESMGIDLVILRMKNSNINFKIFNKLKFINAGIGKIDHPSQSLLDIYTIKKHIKDIENKSFAIIGDSKNSRVARSYIELLKKFNVKRINIIGPENLILKDKNNSSLFYYNKLDDGIKNVDVIFLLRIQKERMKKEDIPNFRKYNLNYGLNNKNVKLAKKDVLILHPGPVNYGIEISKKMAFSSRSLILKQVSFGVPLRMAIIKKILL